MKIILFLILAFLFNIFIISQSLTVDYETYNRDDGIYIESVILTITNSTGEWDKLKYCIDAKEPRFYTILENVDVFEVIWSERNNYNAELTLNGELVKYCKRYPYRQDELLTAFRRLWNYYSDNRVEVKEKEVLEKLDDSFLNDKLYTFYDNNYKGTIKFNLSSTNSKKGSYSMQVELKNKSANIKGNFSLIDSKIVLSPDKSKEDITWGLISKSNSEGLIKLKFKDYNDSKNTVYLESK